MNIDDHDNDDNSGIIMFTTPSSSSSNNNISQTNRNTYVWNVALDIDDDRAVMMSLGVGMVGLVWSVILGCMISDRFNIDHDDDDEKETTLRHAMTVTISFYDWYGLFGYYHKFLNDGRAISGSTVLSPAKLQFVLYNG